MPFIRFETGPLSGRRYQIGAESLQIGRDEHLTLQIPDQGASRHHADIFRIGEMCFIRDNASRNGTFVNEERIKEELLQAGDRIRIGTTVMILEEEDDDGPRGDQVKFHGHEVPSAGETTVSLRLGGRREESRLTGHLDVLVELSRCLRASREVSSFLNDVLKIVVDVFDPEEAYVFLRDRDTDRTRLAASHEKIRTGKKVLSRTIIKRALTQGRAILTEDAATDERFGSSDSVALGKIHSVMCAPLVALDRASGVLYLTAPFQRPFGPPQIELLTAVGIHAGLGIEAIQAAERQRVLVVNVVRSLVAAAEMNDPTLQGHSERVFTYSAAICNNLSLTRSRAFHIQMAALLHDVGKIATAGRDVDPQAHVHASHKILEKIPEMEEILPGVLYHHECLDGTGFPFGKRGDEIPLSARVVAVANQFDHLTTQERDQPGPEGLPVKDALVRLEAERNRYDHEVVAALAVAHRSGKLFSPRTVLEDTRY